MYKVKMRIPSLYWFICAILLMQAIHIFGQAIPRDKQLHLGAGVVIGSWGNLTVKDEGIKPFAAGVAWSALAGIGKEVYDLGGGGKAEFRDFTSTLIGGIVGSSITFLIHKAVVKKRFKINH